MGPASTRKLCSQLFLESPGDDRRCPVSPRGSSAFLPPSALDSKAWLGEGSVISAIISFSPVLCLGMGSAGMQHLLVLRWRSQHFLLPESQPLHHLVGLWGKCEEGAAWVPAKLSWCPPAPSLPSLLQGGARHLGWYVFSDLRTLYFLPCPDFCHNVGHCWVQP